MAMPTLELCQAIGEPRADVVMLRPEPGTPLSLAAYTHDGKSRAANREESPCADGRRAQADSLSTEPTRD